MTDQAKHDLERIATTADRLALLSQAYTRLHRELQLKDPPAAVTSLVAATGQLIEDRLSELLLLTECCQAAVKPLLEASPAATLNVQSLSKSWPRAFADARLAAASQS